MSNCPNCSSDEPTHGCGGGGSSVHGSAAPTASLRSDWRNRDVGGRGGARNGDAIEVPAHRDANEVAGQLGRTGPGEAYADPSVRVVLDRQEQMAFENNAPPQRVVAERKRLGRLWRKATLAVAALCGRIGDELIKFSRRHLREIHSSSPE